MGRKQRKKSQNAADSVGVAGGPKKSSNDKSNAQQNSNSTMKQQNGTTLSTSQQQKTTTSNNGQSSKHSPSAATLNRLERDELVLHKRPMRTIYYAFLELIHLLFDFVRFLQKHKFVVLLAGIVGTLIYYVYKTPGPHQAQVGNIEKVVLWSAYWVWLGVLSSIGLGSGLHTFLLYLGPHIARVTLAAFDCKSLDFPEPPYPTDIICPEKISTLGAISLWSIINKVRLESLMWGAGTALGELPPYFMARAARLSGQEPDDEEYAEYLEYVQGKVDQKEMSFWERSKFKIEKLVVNAGFIGILLFASIPNPLFDLAGIICGHSLVSFWTFFGATLIGKALVKAHVQMLFVILTFSEHHIETLLHILKEVPKVGVVLEPIFKEFFIEQKRRLHRSPSDKIPEQGTSILQQIITVVIALMIMRFLVEIVNSCAKAYHKRVTRQPPKKKVQ